MIMGLKKLRQVRCPSMDSYIGVYVDIEGIILFVSFLYFCKPKSSFVMSGHQFFSLKTLETQTFNLMGFFILDILPLSPSVPACCAFKIWGLIVIRSGYRSYKTQPYHNTWGICC